MSTLRIYRIEVAKWPTTDGQPWARFYGQGAAAPNHEIPAWLVELITSALPHRWHFGDRDKLARVADRIRYDDDRDQLIGVLMPKPKRQNYLSASGVSELAADMRAFGAEVTIHRSEPVRWSR